MTIGKPWTSLLGAVSSIYLFDSNHKLLYDDVNGAIWSNNIVSCFNDIIWYNLIYTFSHYSLMEEHRLTKRLLYVLGKNISLINAIGAIENLKWQFQWSQKLSHQTLQRLTHSIIVTSAWASNRIEWNKLNDDDVERLYKKLHIKKFKTRDEQEIWWYLEVLELVFASYKNMKFNEWLILQLHDMMLHYSDKDEKQRWKYKFWPNRVEARNEQWELIQVIFDPTDPALTPIEMQELIAWTQYNLEKKELPVLLTIANFIFEFLAIHPFQDWNGRMSRILTNLLMLQQWYDFMPFVSHEKIVEQKKLEYYKALNKTQVSRKTEAEDITPWIEFFFGVVKEQLDKALLLNTEQYIENQLSPLQAKVWDLLQEYQTITRKEIFEKTWLSYSTIGQVLRKLIDMKLIHKKGSRRGTVYALNK